MLYEDEAFERIVQFIYRNKIPYNKLSNYDILLSKDNLKYHNIDITLTKWHKKMLKTLGGQYV